MLAHIFVTRVKIIVRDRQTMFWTLMFPIILATFFYFAFSNLNASENFQTSSIAVVNSAEYQNDKTFQTALDSMTKDDSTGRKAYFKVTVCDAGKADSLLKNNKIIGYIAFDNGPKLTVRDTGISQTILREFINDYRQTTDAATTIAKANPAAMSSFEKNLEETDYIKTVSMGSAKPDETLQYFYALIAMACLYGGILGLDMVVSIQANQSMVAARVGLAPVKKMSVFFASLLAATAVQLACTGVLMAYLTFVLHINFGGKTGLVLLACLVSCFTGVTFGAALSCLFKKHIGVQHSVLIAGTMVMSFFSGLFFDGMRYIVKTNAPVLSYLNPANLITDAFYSLYYYDSNRPFLIDIALLCAFSAVFFLFVTLKLRRQRYDSI